MIKNRIIQPALLLVQPRPRRAYLHCILMVPKIEIKAERLERFNATKTPFHILLYRTAIVLIDVYIDICNMNCPHNPLEVLNPEVVFKSHSTNWTFNLQEITNFWRPNEDWYFCGIP